MISISWHNCVGIRAHLNEGKHTQWVDIRMVDEIGGRAEFTIFFVDKRLARDLVAAINSVPMPVQAMAPAVPRAPEAPL